MPDFLTLQAGGGGSLRQRGLGETNMEFPYSSPLDNNHVPYRGKKGEAKLAVPTGWTWKPVCLLAVSGLVMGIKFQVQTGSLKLLGLSERLAQAAQDSRLDLAQEL